MYLACGRGRFLSGSPKPSPLSAEVWLTWSDSTVARWNYARCASKTNMADMALPWCPALAPPSWRDEGPEVRIRLPPAASHQRTGSPRPSGDRRAGTGVYRGAIVSTGPDHGQVSIVVPFQSAPPRGGEL